mmetsp:Transcript_79158/g.183673  ORF Transcript_79158/g.183673 Transcript_79158/m.183673 type:complete len:230 (-) Transcript_79158:471-1160(-)
MGEATTCAGDNESVPGSGSCCSPCNSTAPTLAGENTASERAGLRPSQATSAGAPSARLEQNRQTPPPSKREFPHSIKRAGEILSWNWSCLSGASKLLLHGSGAPNTVCELCTTSACGLLTGSSVEVLTGQEPVSAGMLAELGAAVADPRLFVPPPTAPIHGGNGGNGTSRCRIGTSSRAHGGDNSVSTPPSCQWTSACGVRGSVEWTSTAPASSAGSIRLLLNAQLQHM